jgi:hypothetical protein
MSLRKRTSSMLQIAQTPGAFTKSKNKTGILRYIFWKPQSKPPVSITYYESHNGLANLSKPKTYRPSKRQANDVRSLLQHEKRTNVNDAHFGMIPAYEKKNLPLTKKGKLGRFQPVAASNFKVLMDERAYHPLHGWIPKARMKNLAKLNKRNSGSTRGSAKSAKSGRIQAYRPGATGATGATGNAPSNARRNATRRKAT